MCFGNQVIAASGNIRVRGACRDRRPATPSAYLAQRHKIAFQFLHFDRPLTTGFGNFCFQLPIESLGLRFHPLRAVGCRPTSPSSALGLVCRFFPRLHPPSGARASWSNLSSPLISSPHTRDTTVFSRKSWQQNKLTRKQPVYVPVRLRRILPVYQPCAAQTMFVCRFTFTLRLAFSFREGSAARGGKGERPGGATG